MRKAPAAQPTVKTEDDWLREATQSAVDAARKVVADGAINGRAMISSLSDIEWGWIVCAGIFGWIETKARQAVSEGKSYDATIRQMTRDPSPWESGAVASILPALGGIKDLDWSKPVGEWPKDQVISFAWQIYKMTDAALAHRDEGAVDKLVRFNKDQSEREISAAHGGSLMSRGELDDEVPF